jgi:hypothetical protein
MATLDSLADDVYVLTNRPDLTRETKVALRKAIFKFHSADTFKRDLAVQRIQLSQYPKLSPDQHRWSIDLTEFPRFRRPKFLKSPMEQLRVVEFEELAPDNLFDSYGYENLNYFIIIGSTITIKSISEHQYLDFGYYQYPNLPTLPTDPITSWIADQYPDCLIEEAAGTVFKMIGKDDEYSRYQVLFQENIAILRGTDVGEGN